MSQREIYNDLERKGVIKSAQALLFLEKLSPPKGSIRAGTYLVDAGKPASENARVLLTGEPVRQMVLIKEGLWSDEIAEVIAAKQIGDAKEVMELIKSPAKLSSVPEFIVKGKSLEGYLFPDTYDFPPLLGAEGAVERMLSAFRKKVYVPLGKPEPAKLRKLVIIGSMVELEAAKDSERDRIAGVIYNRLNRGMPLQIDATILYAIKEKRRLYYKDYQVEHDYNTYKIKGLPPGPICSPGAESMKAAANPEKNDFLYYVAMPNGTHLFSRTYGEHLRNIATSRKAFEAVRK